jgi:hypothetical protein
VDRRLIQLEAKKDDSYDSNEASSNLLAERKLEKLGKERDDESGVAVLRDVKL